MTGFAFDELLSRIRPALPGDSPVYLVGGAVRDALLSKPTHDLDFALAGDVMAVGRQVARVLGADFYPLDKERKTARVILTQQDHSKIYLDFAALRGASIQEDLLARDFTMNAMAIDLLKPDRLVDPLSGASDLRARRLRACSPNSLQEDPVRVLRGVRQAVSFGLSIVPETSQLMRRAAPLLAQVSMERNRDELFRILDGPQPVAALHALDRLGGLAYLLPELQELKGVTQSPPHNFDVWEHSFYVLQNFLRILDVLDPVHDPDKNANLAMGFVSTQLGRYRQELKRHLEVRLNPERSLRALLALAALYHDIGKPHSRQVDETGRIRFFQHELIGKKIIERRAKQLRLSNVELERLECIVRHHLRPILLAQDGGIPTRRAIYRFFRDTGPCGVDICLLSLADVMGTYGPALPQDVWAHQVEVARTLLEAWWERPQESVSPPVLITGDDLIKALELKPGRQIGRLLEAIREAQSVGQVTNREEALALARELSRPNPESPQSD